MKTTGSVARRAGDLFETGLNCAESILLAFAEETGTNCKAFPRLATGFCAGVSRTCSTCGALSGGVMAIGLALGRDSAEDSNEDCYAAVQDFKRAFVEQFGTENCSELIDCDLSTEAGRDEFEKRNLKPQCRQYVEAASELVIEALGFDNE